jgi:hypothetical protein
MDLIPPDELQHSVGKRDSGSRNILKSSLTRLYPFGLLRLRRRARRLGFEFLNFRPL